MAGKYSVKETKEVLVLAKVVIVSILKEIKKDGFQVQDLGAFLKSPDFEVALAPALQDLSLVPSELAEVDLMDGLELGRAGYQLMSDVIAAVK